MREVTRERSMRLAARMMWREALLRLRAVAEPFLGGAGPARFGAAESVFATRGNTPPA